MPRFLDDIHGGYYVPIAFHFPGAVAAGVKTPEFIAPTDMEVTATWGRVSAGSGVTYRPVKNGSTNGTTSTVTGTTSVETGQTLVLAAGDRLQIEVVAAGTGAQNLSVTNWAQVT